MGEGRRNVETRGQYTIRQFFLNNQNYLTSIEWVDCIRK